MPIDAATVNMKASHLFGIPTVVAVKLRAQNTAGWICATHSNQPGVQYYMSTIRTLLRSLREYRRPSLLTPFFVTGEVILE